MHHNAFTKKYRGGNHQRQTAFKLATHKRLGGVKKVLAVPVQNVGKNPGFMQKFFDGKGQPGIIQRFFGNNSRQKGR